MQSDRPPKYVRDPSVVHARHGPSVTALERELPPVHTLPDPRFVLMCVFLIAFARILFAVTGKSAPSADPFFVNAINAFKPPHG